MDPGVEVAFATTCWLVAELSALLMADCWLVLCLVIEVAVALLPPFAPLWILWMAACSLALTGLTE